MEIINKTPHAVGFFNTVDGQVWLLGALVARPIFRIEGKELVPDPENPWPVTNQPVKTPFGDLEGEMPFPREGADFIILGNAYAPGGQPATSVLVDIQAGPKFHRRILAIGDRVWEKSWMKLRPTPPGTFTYMPLSYERAYGGVTKAETGDFPFYANPKGKGYYFDAEQAEGKPLPNLEDPEHPIESWKDQPDPVGTAPYPREWALRMLNSVEVDPKAPLGKQLKRIKPSYFNNAHPRMIVQEPLRAGDLISVTNVRPEGDIRFALPDLEMHVHVQLEDRNYVFPLHLEAIAILAEEKRVFFSLRVVFRYRIVPLERRATTLYLGPLPAEVPAGYPIVWKE